MWLSTGDLVWLASATVALLIGYWLRGWVMARHSRRLRSNAVALKWIQLTGADLARVPGAERVLFVQLAHLHNTINLLRRWSLASGWHPSDGPERRADLARTRLAARMLAGTLAEGWKVLDKSFFGAQVSKAYASSLTPDGAEALRQLKTYFRRKNAIQSVRNRFAFHLDRVEIERQLRWFGPTETFDLYVSEEVGNSFYSLADTVVGLAMLNAIGGAFDRASILEALGVFYSDILRVSEAFDRVTGEILSQVLERHVPAGWQGASDILVEGALPIDRLELPFFVSRPVGR